MVKGERKERQRKTGIYIERAEVFSRTNLEREIGSHGEGMRHSKTLVALRQNLRNKKSIGKSSYNFQFAVQVA